MTKKEVLELIAEVCSELDNTLADIKCIKSSVEDAMSKLENIPDEESEITDEKESE